jgi:hypothetical protein
MIAIEYLRPIGHTKLEMLGGLQVSLLFGERDQLVQNTATLDFNRFSADELLSGLTGQLGVQYMHHLTEHRTIFARTTLKPSIERGGTATDPVSDFGIYGLTFGAVLIANRQEFHHALRRLRDLPPRKCTSQDEFWLFQCERPRAGREDRKIKSLVR